MTDESRDVDTLLKINKLGMYSKGMQKGLTIYDKNFYDEEQMFRDNTGGGLLFGGTGGAVKWLQAQDYTGAATYYNLLLNPRGGSIGIGSTTVYNGGGFQKVISFYSPSSLALTYVTDTQQYQVGIASNDYRVYDFTQSTYRFVIKGTTGNVVIGDTTDAGYKLQVNGTTNSSNYRTISNSATIPGSGTATILTLSNTATGVYIVNANFGPQGNQAYGGTLIIVANAGSFRVVTNGSGTSCSLTLSGNNVQITNPIGAPLDATANAILIGNT
jgi:hypothetical protein